jgi:hypothetical protein
VHIWHEKYNGVFKFCLAFFQEHHYFIVAVFVRCLCRVAAVKSIYVQSIAVVINYIALWRHVSTSGVSSNMHFHYCSWTVTEPTIFWYLPCSVAFKVSFPYRFTEIYNLYNLTISFLYLTELHLKHNAYIKYIYLLYETSCIYV